MSESPNILILYYSKSGNNLFLAREIQKHLNAEVEVIRPFVSLFPLLLVMSYFKLGAWCHNLNADLSQYDRIIICGPIWMGSLISPVRGIVNKYKNDINELHFLTSCGGSDDQKDSRFGYVGVFNELKKILKDRVSYCGAFPIPLVLKDEDVKNNQIVMETHLNKENFVGEIRTRLDNYFESYKTAAFAS